MKKANIAKVALAAALMMGSTQVEAQGFLKKLAKTATETVTETASTAATDAATTSATSSLNLEDIPTFSVQKIKVKDAKNADGTDVYQYRIVDQNGNLWSEEQASTVNKNINNAILKIAGKVALGAGLGALKGGVGGALAGALAGGLLSIDDAKKLVKMKKIQNQSKKVLEEYQKNFDEEGAPRDASVDTSKIAGIDITENTTLSKTTEEIKSALASNDGKEKALAANDAIKNILDNLN